jgi:FkbM family methyltransferase
MQATETSGNRFRWILFEGDMISDAVRSTGSWEPHFLEVARRFVHPGDTVFDAGANFGFHTLELARLVGPNGRVAAFEPQRIVFQQLAAHLFINGISNVWAYPFALGDVAGMCAVPALIEAFSGNIGATPIGEGAESTLIAPLDQFRSESIAFGKIDIQGSETACLRGASMILTVDRPILFLEIEENWLRRLGSSSKELVELLFAYNYSVIRIETEWPTDCICYPREKTSWVNDTLQGFQWRTTLLEGSGIDFTFEEKPYWVSFAITR